MSAPKKRRANSCHPETPCLEKCAACDRSINARAYHISNFREDKTESFQKKYGLTDESACICGSCFSKMKNESITPDAVDMLNDHDHDDESQTPKVQCVLGTFGLCENVYQHYITIDDWELFSSCMGLETSDPLNRVPLCKVHYNKWDIVSKERKCSNCYRLIRKIKEGKKYCVRNYDEIRNFFEEIGDRIAFQKDQRVCRQCYNEFTMIGESLKKEERSERDSSEQDLEEILQRYVSLNQLEPPSQDDVRSRAMYHSVIDVIRKLQNHEPFLFGDIYNCYKETALRLHSELADSDTIGRHWMSSTLLANILIVLNGHIRYSPIPSQTHMGTLVWRRGANVVHLLHKSVIANKKLVNACTSTGEPTNKNDKEADILKNAAAILNRSLSNLATNLEPKSRRQDFSQFRIDDIIHSIPCPLCNFTVLMTENETMKVPRKRATEEKPKWFSNTYVDITEDLSDEAKKRRLRAVFSLCHSLYTLDDRCSYPLHLLLGEVVHGIGGSDLLMQILNRFGVVSSLTKVRQNELEEIYTSSW